MGLEHSEYREEHAEGHPLPHCDQAMDAIGGPKTLMRCLKVLRARPVVAAFGERPMSLVALLQASPYLFNLGINFSKPCTLHSQTCTGYESVFTLTFTVSACLKSQNSGPDFIGADSE